MMTLSKCIAVGSILVLGAPSPALALRAAGLEESNQQPVLQETPRGSSPGQRTAGLEEEPIAAALKETGMAAVDVAADGTATINGQPLTVIPSELRQPGFFEPGSRTIVARPQSAAPPELILIGQIPLDSNLVKMGIGVPTSRYVNLQLSRMGTSNLLVREVAAWVRRDSRSPIAVLCRSSFLDEAAARRVTGRYRNLMVVGLPPTYPVHDLLPTEMVSLLHVAQIQGGRVLYLSATTRVHYRSDRVLLIAA